MNTKDINPGLPFMLSYLGIDEHSEKGNGITAAFARAQRALDRSERAISKEDQDALFFTETFLRDLAEKQQREARKGNGDPTSAQRIMRAAQENLELANEMGTYASQTPLKPAP